MYNCNDAAPGETGVLVGGGERARRRRRGGSPLGPRGRDAAPPWEEMRQRPLKYPKGLPRSTWDPRRRKSRPGRLLLRPTAVQGGASLQPSHSRSSTPSSHTHPDHDSSGPVRPHAQRPGAGATALRPEPVVGSMNPGGAPASAERGLGTRGGREGRTDLDPSPRRRGRRTPHTGLRPTGPDPRGADPDRASASTGCVLEVGVPAFPLQRGAPPCPRKPRSSLPSHRPQPLPASRPESRGRPSPVPPGPPAALRPSRLGVSGSRSLSSSTLPSARTP